MWLLLLLSCAPQDDGPDCDDPVLYYEDADTDGFGGSSAAEWLCAPRSGWVTDSSDCDDADHRVNPDMTETCDGVDQDCDGEIDEDASDAQPHYFDGDGDGYGDFQVEVMACLGAEGWSLDRGDCDDSDPEVYPGAVEVCDGRQTDCSVAWDEDAGLATFYPAGGLPAEDWSETLGAGSVQWPVELAWIESGTMRLCGGPWYLRLEVQADLTLEGPNAGAMATLSGAGQFTPVSVVTPGVSFTGRHLELRAGYAERGGGFSCTATAQVELTNVKIHDNGAQEAGGFYIAPGCAARLQGVDVEGNVAVTRAGGGLIDTPTGVELTEVTFNANRSSEHGGGLAVVGGGDAALFSAVFTDNNARWGGGLHVEGGADVRLSTALFSGDSATQRGGGVHVSGGALWGDDVIVSGASASSGGGLYLDGAEVDLSSADLGTNDPDDVYSADAGRSYSFDEDGPLRCDAGGCAQ